MAPERQMSLTGQFRSQPPPPPGSLKAPSPTDWAEVPLIADDEDGLPRKVYGRITSTGNLEIGIESRAALEALRAKTKVPTAPASMPAGMSVAERTAFHAQHNPKVVVRTGGGAGVQPLPEEFAPNVRAQRLAIEQRLRLGKPLIPASAPYGEIPLTVAGRPVPPTTSPQRVAFATALVPGIALQALDQYIGLTHRTDAQIVNAAAYALFTSRFTPQPTGVHVAVTGERFRPAETLFRRGVLGQAFVPGQFPPGYTFGPTSVASSVPVTTDTVAALEFFVRQAMRGGGLRGRGTFRTISPPRRTRIANYLSGGGWRHCGTTPGFSVYLWCPRLGPAPTD